MIYIFIIFFVISCAPQKNSSSKSTLVPYPKEVANFSEENTNFGVEENSIPLLTDEEIHNKISQIIDFNINEPVLLNSPKRFLQISILFTLSQNSNYSFISQQNLDDSEISNYMNQKREFFYKSLGLTEDAYINYGIQNAPEIEEFLANNFEFAEIYELVQSHVTD